VRARDCLGGGVRALPQRAARLIVATNAGKLVACVLVTTWPLHSCTSIDKGQKHSRALRSARTAPTFEANAWKMAGSERRGLPAGFTAVGAAPLSSSATPSPPEHKTFQ